MTSGWWSGNGNRNGNVFVFIQRNWYINIYLDIDMYENELYIKKMKKGKKTGAFNSDNNKWQPTQFIHSVKEHGEQGTDTTIESTNQMAIK